ncbi:TIGR02234 family membrane protein [Streptomyces sp. NPDC059828]|uniref:TIGR02234 family membrane protein n=1 Tax=Streptomyces sp. NPDC059828 TaxID=3346965 RepID=UPI00365651BC
MGCVSAASVPQPRTETARAAQAANSSRRSLAAALLLGAAGAAVVLLASGQTWAQGAADAVGGSVPLKADGRDVTGVPAALAVVGLAALVAVFAVRRAGRLLVSVLLTLSGAGAAVAAFLGAGGSGTLDEQARRTTGTSDAAAEALTHTVWPFVTAGGGLLILLAGLLALRFGRSWPAMSGRYEREGGSPRKPRQAADPDRPEELWKALDRGEDPTGDQ